MSQDLSQTLYRSGQQPAQNQNNNSEYILQQNSNQNKPKIKILSIQPRQPYVDQQQVQENKNCNQSEPTNYSNGQLVYNHQKYDKNQSSDTNTYSQDQLHNSMMSKQLSTNTQSQDQLHNTMMMTQLSTCYYCQNVVKDQAILLTCLHRFHIDCLKELIKNQMYNNYPIIQCLCQTKISSKILRQFYTTEELDQYFSNHLFQLLQKYPFLLKKNQVEKFQFDYSDYSKLINEAKQNNKNNIQFEYNH